MVNRCSLFLLSLLIMMSESSISEKRFYVFSLCPIKDEILNRCDRLLFNKDIEIFTCQGEEMKSGSLLECSSEVRRKDESLMILSTNYQHIYCGLEYIPSITSSTINLSLFHIEYINCKALYGLKHSQSIQPTSEYTFHELSKRRIQTACNISLNIYSSPLPARIHLLHVMNKCSPTFSLACNDTATLDIIPVAQSIPFTQQGSNSYISAQYDVGLDINSYTIEVLSLVQGGVRRECWGNDKFEGVPFTTEYTTLLFTTSQTIIYAYYYTPTPSCRIMGYYRAKDTAQVTVQIHLTGTAKGWIFHDSPQPNLANIQSNQLTQMTVDLVKDQLYFLRIDYNYRLGGLSQFNVTYPNEASAPVSLNDLYYPIRTDYSPLDLSSLSCNLSYFLPENETNGDILCPVEDSSCIKIAYTKNIAYDTWNPLCEYYRWENGIQICEKCKGLAVVSDGVCICPHLYYIELNTNSCINTSQKYAAATNKIMLIISDPCATSSSWTCEQIGEPSLMFSSIFRHINVINVVNLFTTLTLNSLSTYSFQFNSLIRDKLNLTCWSGYNFTGSVLYTGGVAFSNTYAYLPTYRSCRWEGFIYYYISAGDVEFIISGNSDVKFWFKNDYRPAIIYNCCTSATYRIRIALEQYYYIRLDITHSLDTLNINMSYRTLPSGSEIPISTPSMLQPIRLSMPVITGTPSTIYRIETTSYSSDSPIYLCPLICTSCDFSLIAYNCLSCIDGAELLNGRCRCAALKVYNQILAICESFPILSTTCIIDRYSLACSACVQNAVVVNRLCECITTYYEDRTTNSCKPNACHIKLNLTKSSETEYVATLLEITNPCESINSTLCEDIGSTKILGTRKLIKFTDYTAYISAEYEISRNSGYTLSMIHLLPGSFLLETFPSSNWTGTPVASISSLDLNLPNNQGKSYRLQGYLKFTTTNHYAMRFTCPSCSIYLDLIEDPWEIPSTGSTREYYFIAEKYYHLRIDFPGVPSADLRFQLLLGSNLLTSDYIYYADSNSISRWDITSCDDTIHTTSIKNGFRYCPLFCASCNIGINISSPSSEGVCDTCIENGELDGNGGCVCSGGYYSDGIVEKCNKCPDICMTCSWSGNLICDSCIGDAELVAGNCICKLGYYYDPASTASCSKCPGTCISCSLMDGKVVCDSCILNSYLVSNMCECNSGYVYSSSSPDSCYKKSQFCTDFISVDNTVICTSCVENAEIEGIGCKCSEGFYTSLTKEDVCEQCPEVCSRCSTKNLSVICESCIEMYYMSVENPGTCLRCNEYCKVCEEFEGNLRCLECIESYQIDDGRCLCDLEDYFMGDNKCNMKLLELIYSSEPNIINLYFSKRLTRVLDPSYINIEYPSTIDLSLISYTIKPIQEYYSYSLHFVYLINIDETITIRSVFSNEITDRQHLTLNINYIEMNLILYTYQEYSYSVCDELCEECYSDICIKCIKYAYLDHTVCRCYTGKASDTSCKQECPENMKINNETKSCVACDESCNDSISNENSSSNTIENQARYSPQEIKDAKVYSSTSSNVSNGATSLCLIVGFLTSGLDKAWSLMNVIQIFRYIPLISIEIPLTLRESLISQDNSNTFSEIFKDLPKGPTPYTEAYEAGFETGLFIYNSSKTILTLMIIITSHILLYSIHRISKGKIKEILGKILSNFYYGIYLRTYLQAYMDLVIHSLIQIFTVIYNLAKLRGACTDSKLCGDLSHIFIHSIKYLFHCYLHIL